MCVENKPGAGLQHGDGLDRLLDGPVLGSAQDCCCCC